MTRVLGLDIGIASLGWGYIDTDSNKIIAAGVRTFTKAETPKNGKSLAEPRRLARSARRRLGRRRHRMNTIRSLFSKHDLLTESQVSTLYSKAHLKSPWQLRAEGLDRLLQPDELARCVIHIAKRRGFKSNRKNELKDSDIGKLLQGVSDNKKLFKEKQYRSVGEMFYKDEHFTDQKRNKSGDYSHTVARDMLAQEISLLFETQRNLGNRQTTKDLEEELLKAMLWQLSFDDKDNILKMIGKCRFEHDEYRAPKNSYSGERFVLWSKLNNLTLYSSDGKRHISLDQMREIEALAYKNSKVTYKQIRKLLSLDEDVTFVGLQYNKEKDVETETFMQMKGYHDIRKKVEGVGESHWTALSKNTKALDSIAVTLTRYKTEENIYKDLKANNIQPDLFLELSELSFSKHLNLSIKAITKLLPYMEQGMRYDQACIEAKYEHQNVEIKTQYLPVIDKDDIRNPVVIRALTQARKLINAIIREHGSPQRIHIELARELSKNFKDRKEIEKKQKEFRTQKEDAVKHYIETFETEPKGLDLLKFRLHKQQSGYCVYSGKYLDPSRLIEPGYVDIDHIIPYSRSNDNGLMNKVLCLTSENRQKGNAIPNEYFVKRYGDDSEEWRLLEERVKTYPYSKRTKILRKFFTDEDASGFKERNLSDTRYISRYLKGFIENHLELAPSDYKVPVQTNNGALTSLLRARWGLFKNRDENDLHHAVDALIVAGSTPGMIKRISDYHRRKELYASDATHIPVQEIIDTDTGEVLPSQYREVKDEHFPLPWDGFRDQLLDYVNNEIFVSRMPNRKVRGSAHKETIRSAKYLNQNYSVVKTPLSSLTLSNIEDLHDKNRNRKLYGVLKQRLEDHGGNAKKAFSEPIYMPRNDGTRGSLIRSVKLQTTTNTGVAVNEGIADNGSMVRVDVFTKDKKYYLVPLYVSDMILDEMPNMAITANNRDNWVKMDSSYKFTFSLFPNDLVRIKTKDQDFFAYYRKTHSGDGRIYLDSIRGDWRDKAYGSRNLSLIQKYEVDFLGNYFAIKSESRLSGMA